MQLSNVIKLIATQLLLAAQSNARVFSRCELADQLAKSPLKPSSGELSTWMCILFWESGFNTKAFKSGNFDGSSNYGLFQISDLMWCNSTSKISTNFCTSKCDGKELIVELRLSAARVMCSAYFDNNIDDDIKCASIIYSMQGFNAW